MYMVKDKHSVQGEPQPVLIRERKGRTIFDLERRTAHSSGELCGKYDSDEVEEIRSELEDS